MKLFVVYLVYIVYICKTKLIRMETITIKRTTKGTWMKKFDTYETSFTKISKKEALEDIKNAREQGRMFSDDKENTDLPLIFGYEN